MVGMACPAGASAGQARRPGRGLWPVSPDHSGSVGRAGPRAGFRLDSSQDTSCPALGVPWREKLGGGCFLGLASVPSPTPRNLLGRCRCHPGRPCSPLLSGRWACGQVHRGATHHRARST